MTVGGSGDGSGSRGGSGSGSRNGGTGGNEDGDGMRAFMITRMFMAMEAFT